MNCDDCLQKLYSYELGLPSEEERASIRSHLASCGSCSKELEHVRKRIGLLDVWEGMEPTCGLAERVMTRAYRSRTTTRAAAFLVAVLVILVPALVIGMRIAQYKEERRLILQVEKAAYRYHMDHGEFPPDDGLPLGRYLVPGGGPPYLKTRYHHRVAPSGKIMDRWGRPLIYVQPGRHNPLLFDIHSFGRNGRDDSGHPDDIKNWDWEE